MLDELVYPDPAKVPQESTSENLELVLHDRALARAGYTMELYCDASDAVRAAYGMRAYFHNDPDDTTSRPEVNLKKFKRASSLVAALLAHGHLGPFRLLPPHQAEFLRNLDNFIDFRAWSPQSEETIREVFLDAVGLPVTTERPSIAQLSTAKLDRYVEHYVGRAEVFFTALTCISHTWWERLEDWTRQSLLRSGEPNLKYAELAEHEDFRRVMHLFEELRHEHTEPADAEEERKTELNSFVDAVVLLSFAEMNQASEQRKCMRRFYDSTGLFRRVAAEAGLADRLFVPLPAGAVAKKTPSMVGSRYLIYRALMSDRTKRNTRAGSLTCLGEKDVQMLEEELAEFSGGRERLPIEKLDEILMAKQDQLGPVMRKLITYAFFDQIWLPQLAAREIQQLRDRLALSRKDVNSEPFHKKYQEIVSQTRDAFKKNAVEVGRLRGIWLDSEQHLAALRKEVESARLNEASEFKPICHLDLVRFYLPRDVHTFIEDFVTELVSLGDECRRITGRREWHRFVLWCHEGSRNADHALRAATVLWLMGATRSLIRYFGWVVRDDAPQTLQVMYAAALLNTGSEVPTAERMMRRLARDFKLRCTAPSKEEEGLREHLGSSIELGYLHFHAWLATKAEPYWRGKDSLPPYPENTPSGLTLVDSAIDYADYALEFMNSLMCGGLELDEELESKRTYILNQRLYYRVEQGNPKRLEEMRNARKELMQSENPPRYWSYTYYDTLARFYEFEGVCAKTPKSKKTCFARALARAEMAVKKAPDHVMTEKHRTVRDYLDHISAEWTRRFG